jgi:hypothetical protein
VCNIWSVTPIEEHDHSDEAGRGWRALILGAPMLP